MTPETAQWVRFAEEDLQGAQRIAEETPPLRNLACFHCQQAAEKFLKALLQELGLVVPKTHDLNNPPQFANASLRRPRRRSLRALTRYAVEFRYPGVRATTRQMQAALRQAGRVRTEIRARLGLPT